MEEKHVWVKALKTFFILVFVLSSIYLVRISISFFKENSEFKNFKKITLKILHSNQNKSGEISSEKQIEIEDLQHNTLDTISIEKLIPDEQKRLSLISNVKAEEPVSLIIVENPEGEINFGDVNYKSYSETEYEQIKTDKKNKYLKSLRITSLIMLVTFSANGLANKVVKKKSKRKSRHKK